MWGCLCFYTWQSVLSLEEGAEASFHITQTPLVLLRGLFFQIISCSLQVFKTVTQTKKSHNVLHRNFKLEWKKEPTGLKISEWHIWGSHLEQGRRQNESFEDEDVSLGVGETWVRFPLQEETVTQQVQTETPPTMLDPGGLGYWEAKKRVGLVGGGTGSQEGPK